MDLKIFKSESGQKSTLIITIAIILGFSLFSMVKPQGALSIATDSESLGIAYSEDMSIQVELKDINSVEMVSDIEIGEMADGVDDGKIRCGTYENNTFGTYQTYQYIDVNKYIVVKTADFVLVFNLSSERKTESFYEELLEKV